MQIGKLFGYASPFFLVAIFHYVRYATLTPSSTSSITTRARAQHEVNFRKRMAERYRAVREGAADLATAAASVAIGAEQRIAGAATTAATHIASVRSGSGGGALSLPRLRCKRCSRRLACRQATATSMALER